jgi:hypothetical protein
VHQVDHPKHGSQPSVAGAELASVSAFELRRRIRIVLALFIVGLVVSGVTAFPLRWELGLLARWLTPHDGVSATGLKAWILAVQAGKEATDVRYPFLAYGTDWLAFGHLAIAVFFVGPWLDPVRNQFVISAGLVACVGVVLLALIAGPIRGIPFKWRLIDCSFGVVGAVPLILVRTWTRRLETSEAA